MTMRLRDFGSYTVGGRLHQVTEGAPRRLAVTREVSLTFDPRGHFAVEHAYVQYFVPEPRNDGPPVVLVHGGGLSGSMWERTPDNRPGWLHGLLAAGHEVHVLDNVERGRAGFAPGLWQGEPILRSLEDAWTLFRFGVAEGFEGRRPFDDQRFPVDHLEGFARMFVPRWLSTTPMQVAALTALLQRLGGAVVICHSQGAEVTFGAMAQAAPVRGLIAVEPSASPERPELLQGCPTVLVQGDYLECNALWQGQRDRWASLEGALHAQGSPVHTVSRETGLAAGHSHLPMLDRGSDACLDLCLAALGRLQA